ncbi:MAG: hypothetical protein K6A40_10870 [Solobacterium sp.]|nr:hypothetical protein [Solobacterium sp.]
MMWFGKKKQKQTLTYDKEHERPVIRSSICTGEAVAGFQNLKSKHFTEVMLINDKADLEEFMEKYGIEETPETIY